ncbi:MAG: hypothetical protein IJW04_01655 [Ruminococcus sp.]|nr:hypothetical protein [Ruminococcus sp.]
MFDKKQMDAYSNIKAPDELFEKVVNAKPKKSKVYLIPLVSSLAACLILVFGVAVFFSSGFNPNVTFNGQSLTDTVVFYDISPISAMDMRSSPMLCVPIELTLDDETDVLISEGILILENGERVQQGTFEGNVTLMWEIERTGDFPESKMSLTSEKGSKEITLTQNETDGSFTAKIN